MAHHSVCYETGDDSYLVIIYIYIGMHIVFLRYISCINLAIHVHLVLCFSI